MLRADGVNGPLEPWDWRYYAEKRRKAEHDLDEAELKPFFQLDADDRGGLRLRGPAVRAGVRAARRGRSTTPTRARGR
jgi:hypothetical protein